MNARLEPVDETGHYRLSGRLDFDSVAALWRESSEIVAQADAAALYIDLAGVEQSNSAGVALLVEWQRQARQVTFTNVPEQMIAIIKVADLETVLRIS